MIKHLFDLTIMREPLKPQRQFVYYSWTGSSKTAGYVEQKVKYCAWAVAFGNVMK